MDFRLRLLPLVALLGCAPDTFTGADASLDAQANDGGGGGDVAMTDGPIGGDATGVDGGPDFSCNNALSGTVLCDDFDTPSSSNPAQKWSGALNVNGNNSFDTSVFVSPPRSYRASIVAADGGAFADSALLVQSVSPLAASATLTAHVAARVHAIDPNNAIGLLSVSYVPNTGATGRVWAAIIADNGKLNLMVQGDGSSVTATDQLTDVTLDTWVYLQIDMIPSQSKVMATVNTTSTAISTPLAAASAASPIPEVDLGLLNASTDYASVANYDNFLFRIH